MEFYNQYSRCVLSFDGRVLELFDHDGYQSFRSFRIHIRLITSIELAPPGNHGDRLLRLETPGGWMPLHAVGPDQFGEAQQLVAAVQQASHAP